MTCLIKRLLRRCFWGIFLFLPACGLIYPPYHPPQVEVPQQWAFQSLPLDDKVSLPLMAWWKNFDDPVLNKFICTALMTNNSLGEARGHIEQAQGELLSVQLSLVPSLSLMAGYSKNPLRGMPGAFYGVFPAYFSLNVFNSLAGIKAAKIKLEAQKDALNATKLVLIGEVAKAYYTYLAEAEQVRLYKRYRRDLRQLLRIQNDDVDGGISSLIPPQETQQRLQRVEARQHATEDNVIKSQNALHYLMNQNPGPIPQGPRFNDVNTVYPSFASLPVRVLAARPDVAFAEAQYRLSVQNIAVVGTNLLPAMILDDFYGYSYLTPLGQINDGSATFADAYMNWIIDPTIFGDIKAMKGIRRAAYHAYIDTVRKALRDVSNDLSSHQKANERYTNIQQAYDAAMEKYKLINDLYQQGIKAYRDALIERLFVDEALLARNEIKLVQMLSLVKLYQSLGGGYLAKPGE
jgi:multidrug efflux system outer membrane protein